MTEGFDPTEAPTARGRRDPRIQAAMLADEDMLAGAGENASDQEYIGLVPGDMAMAKITAALPTGMGDGWFSYGVQTHVLDTESEEDTFGRIAPIVITRTIDLADEFVTRLAEAVEERAAEARDAARSNRIVPRQ